jgi:multidrug efflux pump subunit AcrA (membrane-fusion protein)
MDMKRNERICRKSASFELTRKGYFFDRLLKITGYALLLFLLLVLFVPWQQTALGEGKVMAFLPGERIQNITTNVMGRILKWHVKEGSFVQSGALLADIVDNDPDILTRLKSEEKAALNRFNVTEVQVRVSENNVKRQKSLLKEGISSQRQVELAEIELAQAVSSQSAAQVELNRIQVRLSQQSMQKVTAPVSGTIQKLYFGENSQLLKPGDIIAHMVPDTENRVAELSIKGRDLPFIKLGQPVQIQFDGWPILQMSGLPELSIGTFRGYVRIIDPSDDGQGNFRIIVKPSEKDLWPSPRLLRQGVKARGWVAMNRVPLWFEIWRSLMSLPPMPVPIFDDIDEENLKNAK